MSTWKSSLFGDNRMNFYGWLAGGVIVIGASLWLIFQAIEAGALHSPQRLLLLAIYLMLLGHFGLALQSYHARVARNLEARENNKSREGEQTTRGVVDA